jgi:hypothetical protein
MTPIGTYALEDLSQGGHAGGPIFQDGTLGGGGHLSLNNGEIEVNVVKGTWNFSSDSTPENPIIDIQLFAEGFPSPFHFNNLPTDGKPFRFEQHGFTILAVIHIEEV